MAIPSSTDSRLVRMIDCRPEKEVPEVPATEESLHVCEDTAAILAGLQPEVEEGSEGTGHGGRALQRLQRSQSP